jgi:hypothetical protein
MRFNFKTIIIGGIVFYVAQFIVSMITGMVLHEGVLEPLYRATSEFWRPELNQEPPDMAALMPRWIAVGLIMSFVFTAIYDNIRDCLNGSAVVKGLKFGLLLALIFACVYASLSGVFKLPGMIWFWWAVDGFIIYGVSGPVLGWYVGKFGSG